MAWPKGVKRGPRKKPGDATIPVSEPRVSEVGHGDTSRIGHDSDGPVPDVQDGSREIPIKGEGAGKARGRGRPAREDDPGGADEGQQAQDIHITVDWENIPLEEGEVKLRLLRDLQELAARTLQARISATENSIICTYCGKEIRDAKWFSRNVVREKGTGLDKVDTLCSEQCYRGFRVKQEGDRQASYATA